MSKTKRLEWDWGVPIVTMLLTGLGLVFLFFARPYLFSFFELYLDKNTGSWFLIEIVECLAMVGVVHAIHKLVRSWSGTEESLQNFRREVENSKAYYNALLLERKAILKEVDCNRLAAEQTLLNPSLLEESREFFVSNSGEVLPLVEEKDESVEIPQKFKKGNIFLIDDDKNQLVILKHHLREMKAMGYKLCLFQSVEEAMREIEILKPCVLVMDYIMYPLNGYEGLQLFRKLGCTAPAIFVSCLEVGKETQERLCPANGVFGQILKPFGVDGRFDLLEMVRKAIKISTLPLLLVALFFISGCSLAVISDADKTLNDQNRLAGVALQDSIDPASCQIGMTIEKNAERLGEVIGVPSVSVPFSEGASEQARQESVDFHSLSWWESVEPQLKSLGYWGVLAGMLGGWAVTFWRNRKRIASLLTSDQQNKAVCDSLISGVDDLVEEMPVAEGKKVKEAIEKQAMRKQVAEVLSDKVRENRKKRGKNAVLGADEGKKTA